MRVHVGGNDDYNAKVSGRTRSRVGSSSPIVVREITDPYVGPTTVTPSSSIQTLATSGKTVGEDIIVDPIPSNYGLITWNGAVLTVS